MSLVPAEPAFAQRLRTEAAALRQHAAAAEEYALSLRVGNEVLRANHSEAERYTKSPEAELEAQRSRRDTSSVATPVCMSRLVLDEPRGLSFHLAEGRSRS